MTDSNYKSYSDLTLDELEVVVQDIENMSIAALKHGKKDLRITMLNTCLLYTSPSPRDQRGSRMPSSA